MTTPNTNAHKVGWRPAEWHKAAGFSRSKLYELIRDGRVDSVEVDGMRIILTPPEEFLRSLKKSA
jgi:hypothetical protein